jgi:hypothetical protein
MMASMNTATYTPCFPLIVANLIERDSLDAEVRAQQDATCGQEAFL